MSNQDEPDVKASYEFQSTRHGGDNKENVEQQSNKPKPFPAGYKTAVVYPMGHERRGTAVIFNIVKFEEKSLHDRTRSCNDVKFLERCFKALQFDVIIYESSEETQLTTEGLKQKLEDIRKSENDKTTDCDCFVCCILTYGQKGVIFCEDHDYYNTKPLGVDDIISNFKSQQCIKLAGRPKLFFIQADDPELLTMTAGFEDEVSPRKVTTLLIPNESDILVHMSNIPGVFRCYTEKDKGSSFIESVTEVFQEYCTNRINVGNKAMDVMKMLTRVNRAAYEKNKHLDVDEDMKVPCVISTLTKKVVFAPK